jgi:hypothetical protein
MPPSHDPANTHHADRDGYWKSRVIPTAHGLEKFFWNFVWFVVIVCLLFSFNPLHQGGRHEDRTTPALGDSALRE